MTAVDEVRCECGHLPSEHATTTIRQGCLEPNCKCIRFKLRKPAKAGEAPWA